MVGCNLVSQSDDNVVVQLEVRSCRLIKMLGALLKDIQGPAVENEVSPSKRKGVGGLCEQA